VKRSALAVPFELTRGAPAFGSPSLPQPHAHHGRSDPGELVSKTVIVTLFSMMTVRLAADFRATGHITGLLLLASEALVVALTLFRRPADVVDRSARARILTALSMLGPPLVQPASFAAIAPETLTVLLSGIGLMVSLVGKASLGRSFGLTPANRGVVCSGFYRFVRHPIYLGYLITHIGFVLANPVGWNLLALGMGDTALVMRAIREEKTLGQDPDYRDYMQRVPWRLVPRVF
jgi:protein-S-isoprenylcysteine O-methyltransferase Ste14